MRVLLASLAALAVVGCTGAPGPAPSSEQPVPTPTVSTASASPTPESTFVPSMPTAPAASTAGGLTADSLPIPSGWQTEVREGSLDEGFIGNGTWVHEREAQASAIGVMSVGCAAVDDSTWDPPVAALEGNLIRDGAPGIALAFEFGSAESATQFFENWVSQLEACTAAGSVTKVEADPTTWLGRRALDGQWSEVGGVDGTKVTLVIVSDGGAMEPAAMKALRDSFRG